MCHKTTLSSGLSQNDKASAIKRWQKSVEQKWYAIKSVEDKWSTQNHHIPLRNLHTLLYENWYANKSLLDQGATKFCPATGRKRMTKERENRKK